MTLRIQPDVIPVRPILSLSLLCLALSVVAATAADALPDTVTWPGHTEIQLAPQSMATLDPAARRLRLDAGIVELATETQPVTVVTPRFTVTLARGGAWVRAEGEGATVWLKDGRARLEHPTSGSLDLNVPMTFVEARGKTAPTPVLPVSRARAEAWSAGLPVAPAEPQPAAAGTGPWSIQVASLEIEDRARQLQQRLRQAGIASDILSAEVDQATHYRVRINGFGSRAEAQAFAAANATVLDTEAPWITCAGRCNPSPE